MPHAKSAPFVAGIAFGVVIALLAVIALRDGTPPAMAQGAAGGPATAGNVTLVSAMSQSSFMDSVFVLSVDPISNHKHLAVYTYANGRTLRLSATRDITWDLKIPMMKNDPPSVLDIKKEVERVEEEARKKKEKDADDAAKKDKKPEK